MPDWKGELQTDLSDPEKYMSMITIDGVERPLTLDDFIAGGPVDFIETFSPLKPTFGQDADCKLMVFTAFYRSDGGFWSVGCDQLLEQQEWLKEPSHRPFKVGVAAPVSRGL